MFKKNPVTITSSVPQNFIPGLTKPRLSIKPEEGDQTQQRKISSICYQGVQVKIHDNPKLPEKLLVQAGLLALSFPAPSKHLNCSEKAEHFHVKKINDKFSALPSQFHSLRNNHDNLHTPIARRQTMPISSPAIENDKTITKPVSRSLSDQESLSAKTSDLLQVPGIGYTLHHVSSSTNSLPDLDYLEDENISTDCFTQDFSVTVPISEKRRSRSFSSGLNYPPELITHKVKQRISYTVGKSVTQQPPSEEFQKLEKERETFDTVQKTLRSKLPKTFQVCASIGLHPMYKDDEQKRQKNKRGIRGGSLPAVFHYNKVKSPVMLSSPDSPTDKIKKWNVMNFLLPGKRSPKLTLKSKSFDDAGLNVKNGDSPSPKPSRRADEERRLADLQEETEKARQSPSLFTRASKYSLKSLDHQSDEDELKRHSNSSIDSGIMMKHADDEDGSSTSKNSNDDITSSIQSAKTVFLTSPPIRCEITKQTEQPTCRVRVGSDGKTSSGTPVARVSIKRKSTDNTNKHIQEKTHDNILTQVQTKDINPLTQINSSQNNATSLPANELLHKPLQRTDILYTRQKHIVKRPNLSNLPHLLNNESKHYNDFSMNNRDNNNFDENQNIVKVDEEDRNERVKVLEDEISAHLKEIDDMFGF